MTMATQNLSEQRAKTAMLNVAHDLRSPLLTVKEIIGRYAKVIQKKDLDALMAATSRAHNICDETLREFGVKALKVGQTCHPTKALQNLVQEIQVRGLNEGQSLSFNSLVSTDAQVDLSETSLKRMVANLMDNSLRAIGNNGEVVLAVQEKEGQLLIKVTDNGCGIAADKMPQVGNYGITFSEGGHGFGLWSIKKSLQDLAGELYVQSIEGLGTEVVIKLPLRQTTDPKLKLKNYGHFVLLDDDELIHQLVDLYLETIGFTGKKYFFKSEGEFKRHMNSTDLAHLEDSCFVVDSNIGQENPVGLNLIETYEIADRAILYTGDEELTEKLENTPIKVRSKKDSPFDFLTL